MRASVASRRLALLAVVGLLVSLGAREAVVERPGRPPQTQAARERRVRDACARHETVVLAVKEIGLTKPEVVRRAGEPKARRKEFWDPFPSSAGHRRSFTPDGPDEAWEYDIDDGVRVTVLFDTEGRTAGYLTTGVREFAYRLYGTP